MTSDASQVVTSIDEHPKRRGRFVVTVGDEPVATVTVDTISDLQLRVGSALPTRVIDALRVQNRRTALLDRALRLLAVRSRSSSELSRTLQKARDRPQPEDVRWVLNALTEKGYLDDARFAEQFVQDRAAARGWGKQRLTHELRRRGVAQTHIGPAMTQAGDEAVLDDARSAHAVALKWRRTHSARDPQRDRQRLYGFLARRGFAPDVIRDAMRSVLARDETE